MRLPILLLFSISLIGFAGCAPAITHGPRVSPGTSGGASVSLGVVSDGGEYPDILPPSVVFLRHGSAADSALSRPGTQVGLQASPFLLLNAVQNREDVAARLLEAAELDVYVQAPDGKPRGAGVIVSHHDVMPYVQYGADEPGGDSWYTSHGLAIGISENYHAVYWAPSIAFREVGLRGRHAAHFQLGGALGFSEQGYFDERRPLWMATAGIVLELNEAQPDQ